MEPFCSKRQIALFKTSNLTGNPCRNGQDSISLRKYQVVSFMKKAETTRLNILQKAFELIYVKGYQTTSIDDIIATTQ